MTNLRSAFLVAIVTVFGFGAYVDAGFINFLGLVADSYTVEENGQQFAVIDLYAQFNANDAVVFNVFDSDITLSGVDSWFHSDASGKSPSGGTWLPVSSMSNPLTDSFVTIGSEPGAENTTLFDPEFIDVISSSHLMGGWFNNQPINLQGMVDDIFLHDNSLLTSATLLGRFSIEGIPTKPVFLSVDSLSLTFGVALKTVGTATGSKINIAYVPSPPGLSFFIFSFVIRGRNRYM